MLLEREITYQNTSAATVSSLVIMVVYKYESMLRITHAPALKVMKKYVSRGPKLEDCICQLCTFEWNRRGTESKKRKKWGGKEKKINAAATGNRTRDLSITDQMSALTNQVHLKIQFRHRFDQNCPFTDSSIPLEKMYL